MYWHRQVNHEKAQYSKFWKSIKFLRNDAQKKKERNSRNLETETDLDLDGGKKGKREKENRNWMY